MNRADIDAQIKQRIENEIAAKKAKEEEERYVTLTSLIASNPPASVAYS